MSPLEVGFQVETVTQGQTVYLTGRGTILALQKMLSSLAYRNTEHYPSSGNRLISIETRIDMISLPTISIEVDAKKRDGPRILLSGSCDDAMQTAVTLDQGELFCCCHYYSRYLANLIFDISLYALF